MKQTQAFLSTYTADVSGVCSALFELGGMTVMHDASGCNSTYNTHDEPRWYDMDALVFISGLSELEAVLGDDEKLIEDTVRAAKELSPRFIALAGTPIPMITGCDLAAIAREIESRSGVPSFFVPSNGIGSYVSGAGQAGLFRERADTEHRPAADGGRFFGAERLGDGQRDGCHRPHGRGGGQPRRLVGRTAGCSRCRNRSSFSSSLMAAAFSRSCSSRTTPPFRLSPSISTPHSRREDRL